jgi:methylmalonyl-CoA mutase cobalamin-binding subunit
LERLRAAMNRQPAPAQVFLCNMGPLEGAQGPRRLLAGILSVGGFEVISPAGLATPEAAAEAFAASEG